jgi:hypothetical protein
MNDPGSVESAKGRRIFASLARALGSAVRGLAVWLSKPANACASLIAALLCISALTWALDYDSSDVVLYFPDGDSEKLSGEYRSVPRRWDREGRAEVIVEEFLLGPRSPTLSAAFRSGVRLETVLYRDGDLYVDISEEAALAETAELKLGLEALRRSLVGEFPRLRRLALTVGGFEPWAERMKEPSGNEAKKQKKN